MEFNVIKTYVHVQPETGNRIELKFLEKVPTSQELQDTVDEVTKPSPEPNQCPMNNPKCPLYRESK